MPHRFLLRWVPMALAAGLSAATYGLSRLDSDLGVGLAFFGVLALAVGQVVRPAPHAILEAVIVCLVASLGLAVVAGWFYVLVAALFGGPSGSLGAFAAGMAVVLVCAAGLGMATGFLAAWRKRRYAA